MPKVTYVQPDGSRQTCRLAAGESLLDGALDNGVPGILGQCGGACTCATCHCYVSDRDLESLRAPDNDERELLVYVYDRRPNSRLACQIRPSGDVLVEIPTRQA